MEIKTENQKSSKLVKINDAELNYMVDPNVSFCQNNNNILKKNLFPGPEEEMRQKEKQDVFQLGDITPGCQCVSAR